MPKATLESAQKDRQVSNTRRSQAFETRPPRKRTEVKQNNQHAEGANHRGKIVKSKKSGKYQCASASNWSSEFPVDAINASFD